MAIDIAPVRASPLGSRTVFWKTSSRCGKKSLPKPPIRQKGLEGEKPAAKSDFSIYWTSWNTIFLAVWSPAVKAENICVIYGGSVNSKNSKEIFSISNVDGGLIGGASLKADDFKTIYDNL